MTHSLRFEMTYEDAAQVADLLQQARPDLASRLGDQLHACRASTVLLQAAFAGLRADRQEQAARQQERAR